MQSTNTIENYTLVLQLLARMTNFVTKLFARIPIDCIFLLHSILYIVGVNHYKLKIKINTHCLIHWPKDIIMKYIQEQYE